MTPSNLKVGDKMYFAKEKKPYIIKAINERFAICTKPFNLKKTVFYTIVDFERDIRGPHNLVFNIYDFTVQSDIDECLKDLMISVNNPPGFNDFDLSRRNSIPLDLLRTE